MVAKKSAPSKKYFTVSEANATLPLVRAIVRDISELAGELDDRQERLARCRPGKEEDVPDAYSEEIQGVMAAIERGHARMTEYVEELTRLGIQLKDFRTGLIDFPCWIGNREVYLCWRLGENDVLFWHELDAGFAGRQELNSLGLRPADAEGAKASER